MKKIDEIEVIRYNPSYDNGLTSGQVDHRKEEGLTNKGYFSSSKSWKSILINNLLTPINIFSIIFLGLVIYSRFYLGYIFPGLILLNTLLQIIFDVVKKNKADRVLSLYSKEETVVRSGTINKVDSQDIVLDDIVWISGSSIMMFDGEVVSGNIFVDQSSMTGVPGSKEKLAGDIIYAGTKITNGSGYVKAIAVGGSRYINKYSNIKSSKTVFNKGLDILTFIMCFLFVIVFTTLTIFSSKNGAFIEPRTAICEILKNSSTLIPSGMYLIISICLLFNTLSSKKNNGAVINELSCTGSLYEIDVMCFDKTGTLTSEDYKVKDINLMNNVYSNHEIGQIVTNIISSTNEQSAYAKSLKTYFDFEPTSKAIDVIPFTGENKHSAATFSNGKTYVLGFAEYLPLALREGIVRRASEYTSQGLTVLILGECSSPIENGLINSPVTADAMIVLESSINNDAALAFEKFQNSGIEVKVISGDNVVATNDLAKKLGINNSNSYISLDGMSYEETYAVADQYSVFGSASAEQKEAIIKSLKAKRKRVAMIGDGDNDILAMKAADYSVSLETGSDLAKNAAQIVVKGSNVDALVGMAKRGRNIVSSLMKICSLFAAKVAFIPLLTLFFAISSKWLSSSNFIFPIIPGNMLIWDVLCIYIPSIVFAFIPNETRQNDKFIFGVLKKGIPFGIAMVVAVGACYVLHILDLKDDISTGVHSIENANAMATVIMCVLSAAYLYKICLPNKKARLVLTISVIALDAAIVVLAYFGYYNFASNILNISFENMFKECPFIVVVVSFLVIGLYFNITKIFNIISGGYDDEDQL